MTTIRDFDRAMERIETDIAFFEIAHPGEDPLDYLRRLAAEIVESTLTNREDQ